MNRLKDLWKDHWHKHIRFLLLGLVAGLMRIWNGGSVVNLLTWPVNLWVGVAVVAGYLREHQVRC